MKDEVVLSDTLSEDDRHLIRSRLNPKQGDFEYLVRADLRLSVNSVATEESLIILDYGADISPYESLFPNSDYRCADIGGYGARNYLLREDGTVPEENQVFDLILSTQVAEHLENPDKYLSECYRLLKPGGRLFLSTHGSYEDHAFPHDYQRWTGDGLKRDLQKAGFDVIYINKLSAGPRAAIYQIERCFELSFMPRNTIPGLGLWAGRKFMKYFCKYIHKLADRWFQDYRIVPAEDWNHRIYICLSSLSYRPDATSIDK
jgi:SAM-dependent methyltransferase